MNRKSEAEVLIKNLLNKHEVNVGDVLYYDKVTSTMDIAANLDYISLTDKTIVITDEQTRGRGRYKRKWYGSHKDCMFSIVLKDFNFSIPYSMIASLGVYNVLNPLSSKIRLKWINDVFWGPKKVSGILTEEKNNRTIIGVGVNINSSNFPNPISDDATSLYIETGKIYDRVEYMVKLIESIINLINEAHNDNVEKLLRKWEEASKMRGLQVKVTTNAGEYVGIVHGINYKTGALKIKSDNKMVELYDGTLSFL